MSEESQQGLGRMYDCVARMMREGKLSIELVVVVRDLVIDRQSLKGWTNRRARETWYRRVMHS